MLKKLGGLFRKSEKDTKKPSETEARAEISSIHQSSVARPISNVDSHSDMQHMTSQMSGLGVKVDSKEAEHSVSKGQSREANADDFELTIAIAKGAFGTVYQAKDKATGEIVAIKKVLQDRRFKNRELQIMRTLDHRNIVALKKYYFVEGRTAEDDAWLHVVMEFLPETIAGTIRRHTKARKLVNIMYTKCYVYQMLRGLNYLHCMGICHRDIKPQNLLVSVDTHEVKLCDFGSAKTLVPGQPNVSYICSRYYRAPELVFEATEYTTAIDVWSIGCVLAELLLGRPLFRGENGVDQLIEIIKVLGTPSKEEMKAMNPNHKNFNLPQLKPLPWGDVLKRAPKDALDLVSKMLIYKPSARLHPLDALVHPFFDDLRVPGATLPDQQVLPVLFDFTEMELKMMDERGLSDKLLPPHLRKT